MTDTLIQRIPNIKNEIHKLGVELNELSEKLSSLNIKTHKGTVLNSCLGDLPDRVQILDRSMRVIYSSFGLPNSWVQFSKVYSCFKKSYHGKDALDSDIEYTNAATRWARNSKYFLEFLMDAKLNYVSIESVTQKNIELLEEKYTTSTEASFKYKFELLMMLKESIRENSSQAKSPSSTLIRTEIFVNPERIKELKTVKIATYDLCKLIRLCEELNVTYGGEAYFSTAMLVRSILDHVPPIFQFQNFSEVSSQYGSKSLKKSLQNLQNSSRHISDSFLHQQIRDKESLPNSTQVDFRNDIDVLLSEIFRILK